MTAQEVTRMLGGRWHGSYGCAACPVCQPERRRDQNALTLSDGDDGRLLAHCKKGGCAFRDFLAAAGIAADGPASPDPALAAERERQRRADQERRDAQAREVWEGAQPVARTIAEAYLRSRGITAPLPPSLRYHPACWHATGKRLPALIALVEGQDGFGVHRTYLRADGGGKATVEPAKAMLGPVKGGAVRLTDAGPGAPLVVAEGIETALSLASGMLSAPATIWAALSATGMQALRLPPEPCRLTVAIDADPTGEAAGRALATRAWHEGWSVYLLRPPRGTGGKDWNDVLRGRATEAAS